ncbi:MAG: chemotaxis protein CheA, partial [Planctomycetia bacterium]
GRIDDDPELAAVAAEESAGPTGAAATPTRTATEATAPVAPPPPPAAPVTQAAGPTADERGQAARSPIASDDPVVFEKPAGPTATASPVPAAAVPEQIRASTPVAETTVRVDVGLLASILDLVGELVLARNQLRSVETFDPALESVIHRINAVTNSLQEVAVKTRLQPIEHLFGKFPRTVRDLAVSCGREVQLVIDGADTELDRTLIESIRDPLTHLVRNAVDHGIEPPDVRESRGKPRAGRLSLRAFHESGQVTIEVADDGAGIAVDAVRAKAIARGLVDADTAAVLPEERILAFIFEPGFSTAAAVTNVSGRGVGMDVVKTNIEAIGGTVDIQSVPGRGTTVRVRVPLTLAIIPALVVRTAGERFALPQAAVGELVPLRDDGGHRIEGLGGAEVIRVRGRLVPVVFLDEFLGLRARTACRDEGTVVIVRVDAHEFGIVVDSARVEQAQGIARDARHAETATISTIVVKPIGGLLAQLCIYSGATVLGDGGVVLILDLRGILRLARLPARVAEPPADLAAPTDDDGGHYLVCQTARGRRVALPLAEVARLERFPATDVQAVGNRRVVRRGDGFTPVIDADALLGGVAADGKPNETVHLVVLDARRHGVGIAVERILDVATADSLLQTALAAPGVRGTLAVAGIATEVLD